MSDPTTTPPGSTQLHELARTIDQALTLPEPGPSPLDEDLALRLSRDRADLVRRAMALLEQADSQDVTTVTEWLREETAALPADIYQHQDTPAGSQRVPPVPPGSTPLRQVARTVGYALSLPREATTREELIYLRCLRDRVRLVRQAMADILGDPDIEHDPFDVMAVVVSLQRQAGTLDDDRPAHQPEPTAP